MTFTLEQEKKLLPTITLEIIKDGAVTETKVLKDRNYYLMGKVAGSDVLMTHKSISRRHAAIICD